MDLSKSYEFFQPERASARVHIIGCGSVGSTLAENLVRCGISKLTLWDFDKVGSHNIHNQMFFEKDIGKLKVEALKENLVMINPEVERNIVIKPDGWNGEMLSGYVFLAVDSIDIRREIVQKHMNNLNVRAMFDFRTGLEDAQHYAADWGSINMKQNLLNSMNFTQEEGLASTPVSACGVTLGVVTTVRLVCAVGVNNFIKFVKGEPMWKFCIVDGFRGYMDCFE